MADAHAKHHDYHLVDPSPWPVIGSIGGFVLAIGAVHYFHGSPLWSVLPGFAIVFYTMYGWWSDVLREGRKGDHTPVVQLHLRYGMLLFIASEVMFFVAWFWAFFDASLFPGEAIQASRTAFTGGHWPPQGIEVFDPWHIPLLNTLILLASGTTVTWAHHALQHDDKKGLKQGLAFTVVLGLIFTALQAYEYMHASFSFGGSIYGSTFFMATGFHGFHVIVGTIFLIVCLVRALNDGFDSKQHFGFEAAAWYWHFVDVVWLFLFASIYIWGSHGAVMHGG
ncbi:MAG: cytochrome c oxidase subunit 3 [Parvibaculum sp.]|nr:cytochrome c oxidase subunit 3 [Parvibaculum sp.]